jgi:heme-degrading monooxygenase HmoA
MPKRKPAATGGDGAFHVLFRLTAAKPLPKKVVESMRRVLPVFQQQPGFLGCDFYHSHDRRKIVTHLRWQTKAHHLACQKSADFSEVSDDWQAVFAAGKVSVETYTAIETLEA